MYFHPAFWRNNVSNVSPEKTSQARRSRRRHFGGVAGGRIHDEPSHWGTRRLDARTYALRIKRLKEEGIVRGVHANLDWHKLGYEFFATVDVKASRRTPSKRRQDWRKFPTCGT